MTRPPEPPTLRAVVLMYDTATGGLILQYPPEVPPQLVLHMLNVAGQSVDALVRQQGNGLIIPRKGDQNGSN